MHQTKPKLLSRKSGYQDKWQVFQGDKYFLIYEIYPGFIL